MLKDWAYIKYIIRIKDFVLKTFNNIFYNKENKGKFLLGPVEDFYENYIGVFIVGFDTFGEDIEDLEGKIQGKMIVGTKIENEHLYLKLSTVNGKHGGYIKISPEINGLFIEKASIDESSFSSRYRINFYGGGCVEYIDINTAGTITYHK